MVQERFQSVISQLFQYVCLSSSSSSFLLFFFWLGIELLFGKLVFQLLIICFGIQRIIRCGGAVDDDMANIIVAQLLYLDAVDPNKVFILVFPHFNMIIIYYLEPVFNLLVFSNLQRLLNSISFGSASTISTKFCYMLNRILSCM